jgi:hypothetical protein
LQPQPPAAAVFASVFALFACNRTNLNRLETDLIHFPRRLRGLVGPRPPSIDTIGRVYPLVDSNGLRPILMQVHYRLKRNKALADGDDLKFAAVSRNAALTFRSQTWPEHRESEKGRVWNFLW